MQVSRALMAAVVGAVSPASLWRGSGTGAPVWSLGHVWVFAGIVKQE